MKLRERPRDLNPRLNEASWKGVVGSETLHWLSGETAGTEQHIGHIAIYSADIIMSSVTLVSLAGLRQGSNDTLNPSRS